MRQLRQQDVQRRREYAAEMREMQKRVSGRPLLLESVTMKNAQAKAERCFLHTLRDVGLNAEFVTAKGQQEDTLSTDGESCGKALNLENKKRAGPTPQEHERTEGGNTEGDGRENSHSSEDEQGGADYDNSDTDVSQQSM
uniref:protein FAM161A-like n=1 Tax=Myxine glutinosa TaxID=7769 RepID=UPI00358FEF5A